MIKRTTSLVGTTSALKTSEATITVSGVQGAAAGWVRIKINNELSDSGNPAKETVIDIANTAAQTASVIQALVDGMGGCTATVASAVVTLTSDDGSPISVNVLFGDLDQTITIDSVIYKQRAYEGTRGLTMIQPSEGFAFPASDYLTLVATLSNHDTGSETGTIKPVVYSNLVGLWCPAPILTADSDAGAATFTQNTPATTVTANAGATSKGEATTITMVVRNYGFSRVGIETTTASATSEWDVWIYGVLTE